MLVRYLTDTDALAWLDRCAKALKPGGIIVIKENLANGNERFTLGACPLTFCDDANKRDLSCSRSEIFVNLRQLTQCEMSLKVASVMNPCTAFYICTMGWFVGREDSKYFLKLLLMQMMHAHPSIAARSSKKFRNG